MSVVKSIINPIVLPIVQSIVPSKIGLPYSNNLKLWLTGRIDSFTLDGSDINKWADQSVTSYDITQSTGVLKPTLDTSDGFTSAKFFNTNGSNLFAPTSTNVLAGNPGITIFIVYKYHNLALANAKLLKMGNTSRIMIGYEAGSGFKFLLSYFNGNIRYSAAPTLNNIEVLTYRRPVGGDHDSAQLYINGVQATAETFSSNTINLNNGIFVAGAQGSAGTNAVDANMYEMIIFEEDLSDSNRELIENDLMSVYSI